MSDDQPRGKVARIATPLCYAARMSPCAPSRSWLFAVLSVALVPGWAASAAQDGAPAPPAPAPLLTLTGRGVQVYRCSAAAGGAAWVLDHPEADLLNDQDHVVGHHGAGPVWEVDDGSSVRGVLVEKTQAPDAGDIPWLVLRATAHKGNGVLSAVETIRRTGTAGGVAPVQGCDGSMVGATVRVQYTAQYSFYGHAGR